MDKKIIDSIISFRDQRNWKQFHNPKDLAISINLEASELLEHFQWNSSEEAVLKSKDEINDELADILIYCVLMADALDVDITEIIKLKIDKNHQKYPVTQSHSKKDKYTDL